MCTYKIDEVKSRVAPMDNQVVFPVNINDFPDASNASILSHVNPLAQKRVDSIIRLVRKIPEIRSVVLFGSSITDNYHESSDIDIGVECTTDNWEFARITLPIYKAVECDIDIINILNMNKGLLSYEIKEKGCIVYERYSA